MNALLCLGEVVPRLDKGAVLEILQTLQRCTAVDHSAPTLMCTLGVASAIYKQVCHGFQNLFQVSERSMVVKMLREELPYTG